MAYILKNSIAGFAGGLNAGTKVRYERRMPVFGSRHLHHAYWTGKLDVAAPLAPTSADFSARLKAQFDADNYVNGAPKTGKPPINAVYGAPYNSNTDTGNYSIPIYEMPAGWPTKRVWSRRNKYYTDPVTNQVVNLQSFLENVPMPDPSDLPDGTIAPKGSDGSIIIRQRYLAVDGVWTDRVWEMWQVAPATSGTDPAGYSWRCSQAGYIEDVRFHPGWWSSSNSDNSPRGGDFGVSAAGFAYSAPILTGSDYWADDIQHMLTVALIITGGGRVINGVTGSTNEPDRLLPATRNDRFNFTRSSDIEVNSYRVPEGARFRLPNNEDWTDAKIAEYAATKGIANPGRNGSSPEVLAKILRCLRDYGFIVGDSAGVVGWSAEHDKTYGTRYNPLGINKRPNWGNFSQQLPWGSFVQLEVPTVQFHTPGPGLSATVPEVTTFGLIASPNGSAWNITASNDGVPIVAAAGGTTTFTRYKIKSPDNSVWLITVDDTGSLETTKAGAGITSVNTAITALSPDGSTWLYRVDNAGIISFEKGA